MGKYLNPGNDAFRQAVNDDIYVDKTMLISCMNKKIDKESSKYVCVNRPRRFGKSMAANMLAAYYSCGCNSEDIFAEYRISAVDSYRKYLNKYDVIHFDVQWCRGNVSSALETIPFIQEAVIGELCAVYPGTFADKVTNLSDALASVHNATGRRFIIIIDEWDAIIRDEAEDEAAQRAYIDFLRSMFKGNLPSAYLSLVYLTGILPMKKLNTQSALNNFDEFTMLDAGELAPYVGFTEEEVKGLCQAYHRDFNDIKRWYDGYVLEGNLHVYNPRAVVSSITRGKLKSYWSMTGTYEAIVPFINMDFDGLKTDIIKMLSGESVYVSTKSYKNDMVRFKNKDDILTLLIHLGYLAYDENRHKAFIPNEEIRSEFVEATDENRWNELIEIQHKSEALLKATLNMDSDAVAEMVEEAHSRYTSIIEYNDENALSCVISMAYYGALKYYYLPVREMPAGRGFADLVFLPKRECPEMPAMLIELKWDQTADSAIKQIKERKYTEALEVYDGDILLIGLNYSKKRTRHECVIEKVVK